MIQVFKQPSSVSPDWYQGYTGIVGNSFRRISNDFLYRNGYASRAYPDFRAIITAPVSCGELLTGLGFIKSKKEFQRALKEGSLKFNDKTVRHDFQINPAIPDQIEFRRGTRYLEIVIPSDATACEFFRYLAQSGLRHLGQIFTKPR